jgi:hypothetical protein
MKKHKILLVGEFSNVHWTLAEGLRALGHEVVVASKGDGWKNYNRDIDLRFKHKWDVAKFFYTLQFSNTYKKFDHVQVINFRFLYPEERDVYNRWVFDRLKAHNKSIFLGAFGDDYYWAEACKNNLFPYSNYDALAQGYKDNVYYNQMDRLGNKAAQHLNAYMGAKSDGIIAGLYDYYASYAQSPFTNKLHFIPFPINTDIIPNRVNNIETGEKIRLFLGIQAQRSLWKGTDKLQAWLQEYVSMHADEMELSIAVSVPYDEYVRLYDSAHVFVDQLYSQGFAMNALQAMAKNKIVLSGGEPEMYAMYGNLQSKPVWNITPDKAQVFATLDSIREQKYRIPLLGVESRKFVETFHHYLLVARQYVQVWESAI